VKNDVDTPERGSEGPDVPHVSDDGFDRKTPKLFCGFFAGTSERADAHAAGDEQAHEIVPQ
jgi:hypothetical protein